MNIPLFDTLSAAPPCRYRAACAAGLLLTLAAGCGALSPTTTPHPFFYSLDSARTGAPEGARASSTLRATWSQTAPTLIVDPPHAASGFDSRRIIYVRKAHKLEYFAHNEWVDTPARMIAPLIVAAVATSGTFRAVVLTPNAAAGNLKLNTEIVRLQHDFAVQPSRVRFTLIAHIVDGTTRQVLASREFDETVAAETEDPYGGVVAANRAVKTVLERLAGFCTEAAGSWQDPSVEVLKRTGGSLLGR